LRLARASAAKAGVRDFRALGAHWLDENWLDDK
jgi:hypothetical protein